MFLFWKFTGMGSTEHQMETSDSRKRPLDVDTENGSIKRSNQGAGIAQHYFFGAGCALIHGKGEVSCLPIWTAV